MIIKRKQAEEIFRIPGAVGRKMSEDNGCEYVLLEIEPGVTIARHALPLPVTFFVFGGTGTLKTVQGDFIVEAGDLIEVESNLEREWLNHGTEKLELLVIKHSG